jgi:hypothetical protein
LPSKAEQALEDRARQQGVGVAEYVLGIVERVLRRRRTFDEILAPVRRDVAKSGMSESELDQLLADARDAGDPIDRKG